MMMAKKVDLVRLRKERSLEAYHHVKRILSELAQYLSRATPLPKGSMRYEVDTSIDPPPFNSIDPTARS